MPEESGKRDSDHELHIAKWLQEKEEKEKICL
jgi:hypothetical protein